MVASTVQRNVALRARYSRNKKPPTAPANENTTASVTAPPAGKSDGPERRSAIVRTRVMSNASPAPPAVPPTSRRKWRAALFESEHHRESSGDQKRGKMKSRGWPRVGGDHPDQGEAPGVAEGWQRRTVFQRRDHGVLNGDARADGAGLS